MFLPKEKIPTGTLSDGKVMAQVESPGGIQIDVEDNLYVAGPDGLRVLSSDGKLLGTNGVWIWGNEIPVGFELRTDKFRDTTLVPSEPVKKVLRFIYHARLERLAYKMTR